jgi:hypothetical protein
VRSELEQARRGMEHGVVTEGRGKGWERDARWGSRAPRDRMHGGKDGSGRAASGRVAARDGRAWEWKIF